MFDQLNERATTPGLRDLFQYVRITWIESALWPPSAWSVIWKAVRTDNDVEGWHRRINERARRLPCPYSYVLNYNFVFFLSS